MCVYSVISRTQQATYTVSNKNQQTHSYKSPRYQDCTSLRRTSTFKRSSSDSIFDTF